MNHDERARGGRPPGTAVRRTPAGSALALGGEDRDAHEAARRAAVADRRRAAAASSFVSLIR
jgi:hypothetical protein